MAMARFCAQSNVVKSSMFLLRPYYRPTRLFSSVLLPRDTQLVSFGRASLYDSSPAVSYTPGRFISFFSGAWMENVARVSAFSDKSSFVPEVGGGGRGNDKGDGGAGGSGGDGGDSSGSSKGDNSPPKSLFSWYLLLLNHHPVTTKAITSALLTLFGDLVCQLMIEKSEKVDLKRLGIFTLLGLVLVGPTLHFWYLTLSKLVPGPGTLKAGARLVLDQFLFSPIFIGVFFSALLTLEGHSSDIVPKLKQDWPSAVVANWKIWIPFQFLNFLLVPQQLQVLAANVIALAWNTYLSFATHKEVVPPSQKDSILS